MTAGRPLVALDPDYLGSIDLSGLPQLTTHDGVQAISASQVRTFRRCPEQFRRRYLHGEKEPPAGAILWGRADHTTFEGNFNRKLATGLDYSGSDLQEVFAVELDHEVDEAGGAGEVDWKDGNHAKVKDAGVKLVAAYRDQVVPRIEPTAVEREFSIERPELPLAVRGRIDLEARISNEFTVLSGMPPAEKIVDRKVTGRNVLSGDNLLGAFIYQLARPLEVDHHLSLKTKQPRIVTDQHVVPVIPERRTLAMLQRTVAEIATAYALYGPDEPWPDAIRDAWACDYCGFRATCPWWQTEPWKSMARAS